MSALLRSGDIKNYIALGEDGQAVYTVSSQLRDAIRFKLKPDGRKAAEYLAIPQRNDMGNVVDYYVPFASTKPDGSYSIVPWISATDEEKVAALIELDQFKSDILALGQDLTAKTELLTAKEGLKSADNILFSRLLFNEKAAASEKLKAIRFPNADHVYLVDGRPVITFWGFAEKDQALYEDPFITLRPPMPGAVPPVQPATPLPVQEEKKRPWYKTWWAWLLMWIPLLISLGLFLLALLWLLLIFFFPNLGLPNLPSFNLPSFGLPSFSTEAPTSSAKKECIYYRFDKILLDPQGNPVTVVDPACKVVEETKEKPFAFLDGKWVNPLTGLEIPQGPLLDNLTKNFIAGVKDVTAVEASLPNLDAAKVLDSTGSVLGNAANALGDKAKTVGDLAANAVGDTANALGNVANAVGDMGTKAVDPSATQAGQEVSTANSSAQDAINETSNVIPSGEASTPNAAAANGNLSPVDLPGGAQSVNVPSSPTDVVTSSTGRDMTLNPVDLAAGNVSFLNGQWRAGSGIQDKATGKPLRLQYQIENGQGKISITRADGVTCVGPVSATANASGVTLAGAGVANCPDNTIYQLPNVVCKPSASGTANCSGSYGDQTFPMSMKLETQ